METLVLWLPAIVAWLICFAFYGTLFLRGPKGRIARMRCALHGYHLWHVDVTPIQGEASASLIIVNECQRCHEKLTTQLEMTPERPLPIVGPTSN